VLEKKGHANFKPRKLHTSSKQPATHIPIHPQRLIPRIRRLLSDIARKPPPRAMTRSDRIGAGVALVILQAETDFGFETRDIGGRVQRELIGVAGHEVVVVRGVVGDAGVGAGAKVGRRYRGG
jgi:hypothetical protein